ncbi:AraC family transcriptional regulator [Aquincola sp. MAHUQ-54]|uniref:AraC family transcriptional regulator n=1 Tax=Aquincola agrisoli TaxID=3119538 RepID=A0AAW9QCU2_9BURK
MKLCIGEPISDTDWTGLPLGRFSPPGHAEFVPVAAAQDTLFVWRDGASKASVRTARSIHHYERHRGVLDLMVADEQTHIAHDRPESPGQCLLVALPTEVRESMEGSARRPRRRLRAGFNLHDDHLTELALALERQCVEGEPFGRLYTEAVSLALLSYVETRYAVSGPDTPWRERRIALSSAQRARIVQYVDSHLTRDITIGAMAREVGFSEQHFVRLFRRSFGETPYQYVLRQRVELAKALLRRSAAPLAQVAVQCGFADQSHFTACFSRRVGLTPARFRQA